MDNLTSIRPAHTTPDSLGQGAMSAQARVLDREDKSWQSAVEE